MSEISAGQKIGKLTAVSCLGGNLRIWKLSCECGKVAAFREKHLVRKYPPKSCGYCGNKKRVGAKRKDLSLYAIVKERSDFVETKLSNYTVTNTGCHNYQGLLNSAGYGKLIICSLEVSGLKKTVYAHRAAYVMAYDEDPKERLVCHHCDNPSCINPEHLFLGSNQDNTTDMQSKGREANREGQLNGRSKLTDSDVQEIRALITDGLNNTEIAEMYPVSHATISLIRTGKSWRKT